jgi:hypothetical protein
MLVFSPQKSRLEEHLVGGTCLARFRVVESATELGHFSCRKREYKTEQLDFTWENNKKRAW